MFIATILFGWTGIYRFSRGEIKLGFVYLFTMGLFGIGWIADIISAYKDDKAFTSRAARQRRGKKSKSKYSSTPNSQSVREKQFFESRTIIRTTSKPDTFFSRYDFALQCLDEIEAINRYAQIEGKQVSAVKQEMNDNKQSEIIKLIDRAALQCKEKIDSLKTKSAKDNNLSKFKNSFDMFRSEMDDHTQEHLEQQYEYLQPVNTINFG